LEEHVAQLGELATNWKTWWVSWQSLQLTERTCSSVGKAHIAPKLEELASDWKKL
jgi:hypothetical protein